MKKKREFLLKIHNLYHLISYTFNFSVSLHPEEKFATQHGNTYVWRRMYIWCQDYILIVSDDCFIHLETLFGNQVPQPNFFNSNGLVNFI